MKSAEDQLKGSFLKFLWYVWTRVLLLPPPTRIQKDVAGYLADGPRKRFISAFRGVGKTFLTAAYVVWRLWKDPSLKIMIVSANEAFATKVATLIHFLINAEDTITREPVPWAELKARPGQRNSVLSFDVGPAPPDKDPSVFATGVLGQMTGSRGDLIIADDTEVPNNSETETQREKLETRLSEFAALLKPGGEVVYLGTWQTQQSVYRGLPGKGYSMRIWPARYPLAGKDHVYMNSLAPLLIADMEADPQLRKPQASTIGGAPTDPARFTDVDLMEREEEWKQAGFLLQFMLDTSLSDADRYPLKTRDLVVMDAPTELAPVRIAWGSSPDQAHKDLANVGFDGDRMFLPMYKSPDFVPYTGSVLMVDPSGRGKDETSYAVGKFLNGTIYTRRWGGFIDGYGVTTLQALADIAKEEKVNAVVVEANFGDGMFSRLLEPYLRKVHPVALDEVRSTGQKEARIIDTLAPVLKQHRLVLDTAVVRADLAEPSNVRRGLYQLTHLTSARGSLKKDDRVDVLAMMVAYFTPWMNSDANDAERIREEKAQAEWDKVFFGSLVLKAARRPNGGRGRGRSR